MAACTHRRQHRQPRLTFQGRRTGKARPRNPAWWRGGARRTLHSGLTLTESWGTRQIGAAGSKY